MTRSGSVQDQRTRDIEFLSLMAHDLRQPLSVVMGMAILLEDHWDELTDEQKRTYVALIARSGRWMHSLIDDVLTAGESVAEQAAADSVSFSVTELIEETIRGLGPHDENRLSLQVSDALPLGYGDPVKQRKVLQNLLDNALKYSGSTTPIAVGVTERKRTLAITVADRGLGIPSGEIATIFDRYARVSEDEHANTIEGSGLGLFVCKAMVNAQGGEIDVRSNTRGVGSIFTYTLPIAELEPAK